MIGRAMSIGMERTAGIARVDRGVGLDQVAQALIAVGNDGAALG